MNSWEFVNIVDNMSILHAQLISGHEKIAMAVKSRY